MKIICLWFAVEQVFFERDQARVGLLVNEFGLTPSLVGTARASAQKAMVEGARTRLAQARFLVLAETTRRMFEP